MKSDIQNVNLTKFKKVLFVKIFHIFGNVLTD